MPSLGAVIFSGQVLSHVVEFLVHPSNPNTINSKVMIYGMCARLTIRKLYSESRSGPGQVFVLSSLKLVEFDLGPVSSSS